MKIARLQSIALRIPFSTGGSSSGGVWSDGGRQTVDSLLVAVTTDTGITGWGETFGYRAIPATKAAIDEVLAPDCIGRDVAQRSQLMLDLQKKFHVFGRSGAVIYGLSAIDIALWDIAGKAAGQPIHELLGGAAATTLACYASLTRYAARDLLGENVLRVRRDGFQHLKLHEIDIDCVAAAREAAGDTAGIMLDVNCPWSVGQAIEMARKLRPYDLRWLEEPVWPPENYAGLAQVRRESGIPIAAGENASTQFDFQHLLEAKAVDIVQPSPAKMGGITEISRVFAMAQASNTTVMVHTFYDGPGLLAAIHASAALGSADALVEWRYFDLEAQLYGGAVAPYQGRITVPQGPGLGHDPDPDVIRDYRLA